MGSPEEEDGVIYVSVWKCFALLESPMSQARISIDCLEITALFLIAFYWLLKQHKVAPPYRVVGWYNLGPTFTSWIIYAIYRFVVFLIVWCPFVEDYAPAMRMAIAQTVFHWISVTLLLATVPMPINRGLDRVRNSPSPRWELATKVLTGAFTALVVAYLAVMVWEVESSIKNDTYGLELPTGGRTHHYRSKDIGKALETLWLLLAILGVPKMDASLRRAAPAGVRLPRSLKRWTYALAFFLFAHGFVGTFVAFWGRPPMNYLFYRSGYLEENVPIMVLPVFFYLAALVSVVEVAKWLGNVLAHPGVYEVEVSGNLEKIENYCWVVDGWISFCRWWMGLGRLFMQLFKD